MLNYFFGIVCSYHPCMPPTVAIRRLPFPLLCHIFPLLSLDLQEGPSNLLCLSFYEHTQLALFRMSQHIHYVALDFLHLC